MEFRDKPYNGNAATGPFRGNRILCVHGEEGRTSLHECNTHRRGGTQYKIEWFIKKGLMYNNNTQLGEGNSLLFYQEKDGAEWKCLQTNQ